MEHVIPPRDLRSWHNLPISAIANFNPVFLDDLSAPALQRVLDKHPYRFFPVIDNGQLKGMAARAEIESSLAENRSIKVQSAGVCRPSDSIGASQTSLIESPTSTLLLTDQPSGKILAIVTLHDFLRAQISMGER